MICPRTTKFDSTVFRNFGESKEEYTLQLLTFGSIEDFEQTHHSIQPFIWQRQTRCGQWKSHRTTCRTTKQTLTNPMFTIPINTPCMEYLPTPTIHSRPQCRYKNSIHGACGIDSVASQTAKGLEANLFGLRLRNACCVVVSRSHCKGRLQPTTQKMHWGKG